MHKLFPELKYSLYLTVHPFKGFWDIKHEKRGSAKTAVLILAFFVLTSVLGGFYNGFLFNADGGINYNIYQNIAAILLVYLLWCIANWCLTSLFDGEGNFKDICKYTAYSLVPLSVVQLLLIPLSHLFSLQEASFYTMILNVGILWTGMLLFIGTVITHQYTVLKSIFIIILILFGMCIISYIMLLFFNLIQQVLGFAVTFWREASLRFA